jgi:hypothetical protein
MNSDKYKETCNMYLEEHKRKEKAVIGIKDDINLLEAKIEKKRIITEDELRTLLKLYSELLKVIEEHSQLMSTFKLFIDNNSSSSVHILSNDKFSVLQTQISELNKDVQSRIKFLQKYYDKHKHLFNSGTEITLSEELHNLLLQGKVHFN